MHVRCYLKIPPLSSAFTDSAARLPQWIKFHGYHGAGYFNWFNDIHITDSIVFCSGARLPYLIIRHGYHEPDDLDWFYDMHITDLQYSLQGKCSCENYA